MDSEDEILKIITQENGLWDGEYENNMFKEVDYTSTFDSLKRKRQILQKIAFSVYFQKPIEMLRFLKSLE